METSWYSHFLWFLLSDEFVSVFAVVAVWGFFISGLDDLFIDLRYLWGVFRRNPAERPIRMEDADRMPEKPIAVMVPAWQEASVIRSMLMRNIANIDYVNYHIFVGTYPNDPDTQREVDAVINFYRRIRETGKSKIKSDFIHQVVSPNPGPTNKANNLNSVFKQIKVIENDLISHGDLSGPFEIFVMHDCEDVVHPKELKLFNYLITNAPKSERDKNEPYQEKFDFVQTPVFPLEIELPPSDEELLPLRSAWARLHWYNPASWINEVSEIVYQSVRISFIIIRNLWRYAVSATYMEEFAEHHTKDMIVRRSINGLVPSAGVGTGINRKFLLKLEEENPKGIFNDIHLAEDYEISLKLKNLGANQFFAIEPVTMTKYKDGDMNVVEEVDEFIATKEYFPDAFRKAVRQKARWIMGITYQTMFPGREKGFMRNLASGWEGDWKTRYTLIRDRKALITNYINILGYFVFLYCLTKLILVGLIDYQWSFSKIFPYHSYIWWLVFVNTVLMIERFMQRFHAVQKIYSPKHALYYFLRTLTLVGLLLGNLINFMATVTATWRYAKYIFQKYFGSKTKKVVKKDSAGKKVVVNQARAASPAWGKTDHNYLSEEQMREYVNRIGELAVRSRLITAEQLQEALKRQAQDRSKRLGDILAEMNLIDEVGFSMLYATQLSMPAQEIDPFRIDHRVLRLIPEELAQKHQIVPLAIDDAENLIVASSTPLSDGDREELQRRTGHKIKAVITYQSDIDFSRRRAYGMAFGTEASHVPQIGFTLLTRGIINEDQLSDVMYEQSQNYRPLGEILVNRGYITSSDLNSLLNEQQQKRRQLGDVLLSEGRITRSQLNEALFRQKKEMRPLGEILLAMGAVEEQDLDDYFRHHIGLGFRIVKPSDIDLELLQDFPRAFCLIHRAIPLDRADGELRIAVSSVARKAMAEMLEFRFGMKVELILSTEDSIMNAINTCAPLVNESIAGSRLLGNRLMAAGVLDSNKLKSALEMQKSSGLRLGEVLINNGYCSEENLLEVYADDLYLPFIRLNRDNVDPEAGRMYPYSEAREHGIAPLNYYNNVLTCALPFNFNFEDLRHLEARFPMMKINYVMATRDDIDETIRLLYFRQVA